VATTIKTVRLSESDYQTLHEIKPLFNGATIESLVSLAVNKLREEALLEGNNFRNLVLTKLIDIENTLNVLMDNDGV
jgi:hypothetical protein